eukprot:TRINITY_DN29723_c0_g1_i1.p1 TRINITY_DN29723_c0_g1~~TRINITY_DN29723_c0_g1_i1.p1  ORF type:complete len:409 (+),score=112.65 TRINITY_DN29723_c0_g1_i1:52-1278(+)
MHSNKMRNVAAPPAFAGSGAPPPAAPPVAAPVAPGAAPATTGFSFSFAGAFPFGPSGRRPESLSSAPGFAASSKDFPRAADVAPGTGQMIDLVFAMDCTASMSSYIAEGVKSISQIVDKVKAAENTDIRFGYCAYRDHPPQDVSFVTMCHDFTADTAAMKKAIAAFGAQGGGDGPEAVTAALHECLHFPWRRNAVKIVVLIADAPPHGIGASGDGFPNGDPDGRDPVAIAHDMAAAGVVLYVVACEPSLSNYANAHDVMEGLAQITEGRFLPLTGAALLPDVIVGGAREELALQQLEQLVAGEASRLEASKASKEEVEARLSELMTAAKVETKQMYVTDVYGGYDTTNVRNVATSRSLGHAMANMRPLAQPTMDMHVPQSVGFGAAPQMPQLQKCMARMAKKQHASDP